MRDLAWDGAPNLRDLGGLPTPLARSGRTQLGRVARGPRRELLTHRGWRAAYSWGIRSIVDLRCAYEIGRRDGDPAVDESVALSGLVVVHAPTEDHDHAAFRETCFPILDSPAYWTHNWRLLPEMVRHSLEIIAEGEPGVLVHCSAGRDRTGMITALLLGNAGVPPDEVAADYADSVRAMAGVNSHAPTHDRQTAWDERRMSSWLAEVAPLVQEAAHNAAGVLEALGVDSATRIRLRDLLIEE